MSAAPVMEFGPILRALPYGDESDVCLYFLQEDGADGFVKIGVTRNTDPRRRVSVIQNGNPRPLRVLGLFRVCKFAEWDAHQMFSDLCVSGEWFRPDARIMRHLERLSSFEEFAW